MNGLDPIGRRPVLLRAAAPLVPVLLAHLFQRYPSAEGATLARFGWRDTANGLVLTLQGLDLPGDGDVDTTVAHVVLREPYLLRAALAAEGHGFAVGVVHSHPQAALPTPSAIDDTMDAYLASYFEMFAPSRPYVSLVVAQNDGGRLALDGRVWWTGAWYAVTRSVVEGYPAVRRDYQQLTLPSWREPRVARLAAAFGREAAARLQHAVVGVVGTGGTGSPALEVLARAGVGTIITADPDVFDASNLERVHGSEARDADERPAKVVIQKRHLSAINPSLDLITIQGRLPQALVVDALCWADMVLGCTDSHSARVALSDLSRRHLVPAIDVGVALAGDGGAVHAQVLQLARLQPADRCVYCRDMVDGIRVSEELMPHAEQARRRAEAEAAVERGEQGTAYWRGAPQLNTVGYLTTAAGAMAAGYAIGWLTGRFEPPFELLQADLGAPEWTVVDRPVLGPTACQCERLYGAAEQGPDGPLIELPLHWPTPVVQGPIDAISRVR